MTPYIQILLWLGLVWLFSFAISTRKRVVTNEVEVNEKRTSLLFALITIIPLIIIVGTRDKWLGDTYSYILKFNYMPTSWGEIPAYLETIDKDKGFYVLSVIIKQFAKDNYVTYFLVIAAIQCLFLMDYFKKYSSNYLFSLFLFIASADYISWMFNGIRQFTAVALLTLIPSLLSRKKYISIIILVLIASTFHQSALIVIPIVFIALGKAGNIKTIIFTIIIIAILTSLERFTSVLDNVLADTQYVNVVSDYAEIQDDGTNPIRVLVYSIPAIISLFGMKKIRAYDDPMVNLCVNMSFITAGLYIVSMVTSGIFLGRLPIYTSLYGYILLPWEIENFFGPKLKRIAYAVAIVCYLFYYYYQTAIAWSILL